MREKKVVHRDLSPANLLVADDGTIKLIDFGLCHIDDGQTITLTEEAVGTPHYRAPECSGHWEGEPDIRADLYSAGKLLWTMITGKTAFDREKPAFDNLALSRVLPDVPMSWHLFHLFECTIRHSPSSRFANAEAAIAAAQEVRRLITIGYVPLEQLVSDKCHVCGIGEYHKMPQRYDEPMGQYTRLLTPILNAFDVCSYCFHLRFQAGAAAKQRIAERKALE